MLKLLLFVVPLGLDTFAVAASLGAARIDARARLRLSVVLAAFEMVMPIVGVLAGRVLGDAIGTAADYAAVALLAAVGIWMIVEDDEAPAGDVHGFALLALGLAISLDELAIGFSIGLLGLSIVAAVILIGAQAFVFAQLGARLGARVGESFRENAERVAGVALLGLAVLSLAERLT